MPVPFILGGLAAAAGLIGAKKGIDAKGKIKKIKKIQMSIEEIKEMSEKLMAKSKKETTNSLEDLGKNKLLIMSGSLKKFVDIYKNMKNVNFKEIGINDLENFRPEQKDVKDLYVNTLQASEIVIGGTTAVAGGALLAMGTYGAVMSGGFALASTGTAIGTLSGVAATNATLAWLGGGSLATGGFGMAGGMVVLGGIVAGPALALGGWLIDNKAEEALYNALSQKDEAIKFQKNVEQIVLLLKGIFNRSRQIKICLEKINDIFENNIINFKEIVDNNGYDYASYSQNDKSTVAINVMLAKIIKIIIDTPVLDENGVLNKNSNIVVSCFSKVEISDNISDINKYLSEYNMLCSKNGVNYV